MLSFFKNKENLTSNFGAPCVFSLGDYLGELERWLRDDSLSEIYIGTSGELTGESVESSDGLISIFWDHQKLANFIAELAWECRIRIDPFRPFAGGILPGKPWRWHAVIAPMSPGSPMVVLRRQRFDVLGVSSFQFENITHCELNHLIRQGVSLVIFGPTGCGKTSLLMSLMKTYFMESRLGIAEVVQEIPLLSKRWFRLLEVASDTGGRGGVSMKRILSEMMRLSPQLLVIGELRGDETRYFADFARTGHGGVLTTLHAGSFKDARSRLVTLGQMEIKQFPKICGIQVTKRTTDVRVSSEFLN